MTEYIGGLRSRLVKDSLFAMVEQALRDLGWFDSDRDHSPIVFVADDLSESESVVLNTLSLSDEDSFTLDLELGSNLVEERWSFVLDFYGEDKAIGVHLVNDLKAILGGRMASIGRTDSSFVVYDFSSPLPGGGFPVLFTVEVEDIEVGRSRGWSKPFQRHWYYLAFSVVDYFGGEDG